MATSDGGYTLTAQGLAIRNAKEATGNVKADIPPVLSIHKS